MPLFKWFRKSRPESKPESQNTWTVGISRTSNKASKLWEVMFGEYRKHGGDLNDMHSMLIDYMACRRLFDDIRHIEGGKVKISWLFLNGCGITELCHYHQVYHSFDHCYNFTITENEIKVERC